MKGLISIGKKITLKNDLPMTLEKESEVLVKVHSAALNYGDPIVASGVFDEHLPPAEGDNLVRTGLEFAGVVMKGLNNFNVGDKVYGYVDIFNGQWAHKEFISINPEFIAFMPNSISFSEAATVPCGGLTILSALRDVAETRSGEHVLINGATGGLGILGIQIAKKVLGAKVSAVAGAGQEDYLKSLGADHVINYRERDVSKSNNKYDVILDLATIWMYEDIKSILSENGRFVPADPIRNEADFKDGTEAASKTKYLMVDKGNRQDLNSLSNWVDSDLIKTVVDSTFSLEEIDEALKRLSQKSKRGRIVLNIVSD